MLRLTLAVPLLLAALPAAADPSYTIDGMTCARVQALVKDNGSVILHYRSRRNPGLPLYGRYVSDRRYCRSGEIITFSSVPAADKSCTVKKCVWKMPSNR